MGLKIHLSGSTRKEVAERLRQAYRNGQLRVVRRIHTLLHLAAGPTVAELAELLQLGEQTVRDYLAAFLLRGMASLVYRRPPGRPPKLSKSQRQELVAVVTAGPLAAG